MTDTVSSTETPTAPTAAAPELPLELPLPMEAGPAKAGPGEDVPAEPVAAAPAEPSLFDAPPEAAPPEAAPAEPEPAPPGFAELELSEPLLKAIADKGYTTPTPIQAQAIPWVLMGRDLLGCAQTGTGKTASFALPMLDILSGSRARARMPRSLILEPTRELAMQVAENFVDYGKYLKITHALIIGGESMSDQKDALMRGVDVLIATPGRLIDMFERGGMLLTDTKILVIDEADRMLDMGFIPDVERIVAMLPKNRQTMFFSATMAPEIRRLADAFLQNPKSVTVSKSASVATTITEALVVIEAQDKREALRRLIASEDVQNALIFCNRKRDVDILHKSLTRHQFSVGALHGDMPQSARFATLEKFKAGELRLLCCSDVAARGIDIGGLSHVFNFDVPVHAEDYVHRIGRTGRAGLEGRAFTLADPEDRLNVEAIQKLTGHPIPRIEIEGMDHVEWAEGDGKRRRGRGGRTTPARAPSSRAASSRGTAAAPAEAIPSAADAAEAPRKAPARRRRSTKAKDSATEIPAAEIPAVVAAPAEAAPEAPAAAPEAPVPAERAPRPPRREASRAEPHRPEAHRPEPQRSEPQRSERSRGEHGGRGDRRRRDDDLGPPEIGFGADIPAFMLIETRRRPTSSPADDSES